jgi:hypothetical protein
MSQLTDDLRRRALDGPRNPQPRGVPCIGPVLPGKTSLKEFIAGARTAVTANNRYDGPDEDDGKD